MGGGWEGRKDAGARSGDEETGARMPCGVAAEQDLGWWMVPP